MGDRVLLLTNNLKLHGTHIFMGRFVGPFIVLEYTGDITYRIDLSSCMVLCSVHNEFYVTLLCAWHNNGVHADLPPIEIDGQAEYEVSGIKGHL